jgi:hypothetical protein
VSAARTLASTGEVVLGSTTLDAEYIGSGGAISSLVANELACLVTTGDINNSRTGWSGVTWPAGWHHEAYTYSGTVNGWIMYFDGAAVGVKVSNAGGSRGFASTDTLAINQSRTAGAPVFGDSITIAEFMAFPSALSAAQIAGIYGAFTRGGVVY